MTPGQNKKKAKLDNQTNTQIDNRHSDLFESSSQGLISLNSLVNNFTAISDFISFMKQYAIFGVAIGIVIGNTTQNAVKHLVEGLITPFISVVLKLFFPNLESIGDWTFILLDIEFKPGIVIKSLLEYVLILFIIYILMVKILRQKEILTHTK